MSFCLHLITRSITKIDRMPILNMKSNFGGQKQNLELKGPKYKKSISNF